MDVAQALICKTLGMQVHYQSVLNCQKTVKCYKAVTQELKQLLHDGNNHWFINFRSNSRVQACDSLDSILTQTSK